MSNVHVLIRSVDNSVYSNPFLLNYFKNLEKAFDPSMLSKYVSDVFIVFFCPYIMPLGSNHSSFSWNRSRGTLHFSVLISEAYNFPSKSSDFVKIANVCLRDLIAGLSDLTFINLGYIDSQLVKLDSSFENLEH